MTNLQHWVDIPGYEGMYQVSADGNVIALPGRERKDGKIVPLKVLKASKNKKGYTTVHLIKNGRGRNYNLHRLVAAAFIPNPENKPQVNHKNLNKADNRVENLEWCTASENHLHSYQNGRTRTNGRKFRKNVEKIF